MARDPCGDRAGFMSGPPRMRRADKAMPEERASEMLENGFSGRLGTVGQDGWPYVVPLLYVWMDGQIYVHNSRARGHLRENVDHEPRVCFEVDEPGPAFAYRRFECDTSVAYLSVMAFGRVRVVEDREEKTRFCAALMRKYGDPTWDRPLAFFPRLDDITVYAIAIERLTGKETPLPDVSRRWPAMDQTRSPDATPPAAG
jgi:nitroimidazol reductase NimA-like FMN-containing flavoprotein (pyridoxamine 5'-phosphate oxidase superfamily)